jgi:tetratricopeptide (TPR) repeat protein
MITVPLLLASLSLASNEPIATHAEALRAKGLELGYNLDYANALAKFEEAIAADPFDATAHRLAAATIWMRILFSQGAITVADYLGQAKASVPRRPPPPELAVLFDRHVDKALRLAEQRVREDPGEADAHFQLGAAAALRTTYIATVHGKVLDSVGAGKRAYRAHKQTLSLDPTRKDAALIVGLYRYTVASLTFPMRLMARLAGFESDRQSGIRLVEEAAAYPGAAQTNARLALTLIYNREGRHDDALAIVRDLQRRYPRNRLFLLEEGSTALRAGRPQEALTAIDNGLRSFVRDERQKAFGEEAQWRFQRASALLALGQQVGARRELEYLLVMEAPEWLRRQATALLRSKRIAGGE